MVLLNFFRSGETQVNKFRQFFQITGYRQYSNCDNEESKYGSKGGDRDGKDGSKVKGKVALITGGNRGIGFSCARLLLACGAKGVFLGGRDEKAGRLAVCKLSEEFGENKVIFLKTDVINEKSFERAFKCTIEYFNGLDIVINNAGILQDDKWEQCIEINCKGVLKGTLLGFEYMGKHKKHKGGVIIQNASIVGLQEFHGSPVYGSSKHFVIGLTKNMGHPYYYEKTGVKVMAICPGVTTTDMVEHAKIHDLTGFKGCGKEADRMLKSLPEQPTDACGCCVIKMLEKGKNGSVWVSEDNECYEVKIPMLDDQNPDKAKTACPEINRKSKKKAKCGKTKSAHKKNKRRNKEEATDCD